MSNDILLARHDQDIAIITHMTFKRGADLTLIRDTQAYEGVADTFNEYLSQKDVLKDTKFCMDLFNFYCTRHRQHLEDVHDLHHLRLAEVMKKLPNIATDEVEEWLHKLRNLSWKDSINAIRRARGRAEMPQSPSTQDKPPDSGPLFCCVCGGHPAEKAHWPITERMGGKFTIPLCRGCHEEYHTCGDVTFYERYKRKIGEWLEKQLDNKQ